MKWYEDNKEVMRFAHILVEDDHFQAEDLLFYLKKPWRWDLTYNWWDDLGCPLPGDPNWKMFNAYLHEMDDMDDDEEY